MELSDDFSFEPFNPENTLEQFEDEMNLLYVASTRAMKVLAINGPVLEIMHEFVGRRDGKRPNIPLPSSAQQRRRSPWV